MRKGQYKERKLNTEKIRKKIKNKEYNYAKGIWTEKRYTPRKDY